MMLSSCRARALGDVWDPVTATFVDPDRQRDELRAPRFNNRPQVSPARGINSFVTGTRKQPALLPQYWRLAEAGRIFREGN